MSAVIEQSTRATAPATPAPGVLLLFADSVSKKWKSKDENGNVLTLGETQPVEVRGELTSDAQGVLFLNGLTQTITDSCLQPISAAGAPAALIIERTFTCGKAGGGNITATTNGSNSVANTGASIAVAPGDRLYAALSGDPSAVTDGIPKGDTVYGQAASGSSIVLVSNSGIYTSTDTSKVFAQTQAGNFFSVIYAGSSYYACGTAGLFISTDQGATWNATTYTGEVYCVAVNGTNVIIGTDDGVWLSTDSGATFTLKDFAADTILDMVYASGDLLAITAANGLQISADDGATWSTGGTIGAVGVHIFNIAGELFVTDTSGIYKSVDGGANWTVLTTDFGSIISVVSPSAGVLVATSTSTGVWRSTDSGATWTNVVNAECVHVWYYDSRVWAGFATGNHPVAFSTNDGATWNNEFERKVLFYFLKS